MHFLLSPPRSIILAPTNHSGSLCYKPFEPQVFGFNEMLGYSDAQGSEASSTGGDRSSSDDYSSLRDLLAECGLAVSQGRWQRSIQLINFLSQKVSPDGDSTERVVTHFVDSLVARIISTLGESQVASQLVARRHQQQLYQRPHNDDEIQGACLSFNQVTPFMRFSHLTANQAILEALEGWDTVHIVDVEIMQGVQWPPLMQALAERTGGPPNIRISGAGSNLALLEQTGNRLTTFAASLGLPMFEFHAIHANNIEDLTPLMLYPRQGEALAINCILQLHHMWQNQGSFLSMVHSLQPTIITLADREANYNQSSFMDRFMEAFRHYSALFDSLEATLPPSSAERINVENVWLKGEIMSLLAANEGNLTEAQYSKWRDLLRPQGFNPVSHSGFALSQARLLLRLRYPSEGYQLHEEGDCLLLGWQDTPLFAVSAWN